ncbi:MAG: ABC transporter ATP-binding protein, partial [Ruminococcus sp.]|nr:ABC transporter ATP-binding protein [Ruminococcus sp.]
EAADTPPRGDPAVEMKGVSFRYEKHSADLISQLDMTAYFGEITAVCGANGAGKSTLIKLLAGGLRPVDGVISIAGRLQSSYRGGSLYRELLTMLPSDPHLLFTEQTVMLDLARDPDGAKRGTEEIYAVTDSLGLDRKILERYSFDLSGGELQRAALAKLLLLHPRILLLDEPEKGLDPQAKAQLGGLLRRFADDGGAVIFVTHDLDFAAEYSDRVVMLFGGYAAAESSPESFFAGNSLYTTSAALISRDVFPGCVTAPDLIDRCLKRRCSDEK